MKLFVYLVVAISFGKELKLSSAQSDPSSLNGGSVLAMAGAECVALAVDKRFGLGAQMVNISPRHVLIPHPHLAVAFTGLESDVQTLSLELSVQISSKLGRGFITTSTVSDGRLDTDRRNSLSATAMSQLTSHVLYSHRQSPYFVEPVVVGLVRVADSESKGQDSNCHELRRRQFHYRPFLCAHDMLGAQSQTNSFCCAGVASKSLYGTAEALWRPDMDPDELVATCGKAFLSALERDCLSGYGARIILITKDGIEEIDLACRDD